MSRRHSHNEAVRRYRESLAGGGVMASNGINLWRVLAGVVVGCLALVFGAAAWFGLLELLQ